MVWWIASVATAGADGLSAPESAWAAPRGPRGLAIGAGTALGIVGFAGPTLLAAHIEGTPDGYVLFPLAGAGLVAGSAFGVHLVRRDRPGWEAGGAAIGAVVGIGLATAATAAIWAGATESRDDVGRDVGTLVVDAGLVFVLPSVGAVVGGDLGDRAAVRLVPVVLPADHGPVAGARLTLAW